MTKKAKFKALVIILLVLVFFYFYPFINSCRVVPRDTNYSVVLEDSLYKFTKKGLIKIGYVYGSRWGDDCYYRILFDEKQRTLYFDGGFGFCPWISKNHKGIYKGGVSDSEINHVLVLKTDNLVFVSSISPNSSFLLFGSAVFEKHSNELLLLRLNDGDQQKVVDDYYYLYGSVWLNNHQFVYCSSNINEKTGKRFLYLYDINTKTKKDLHLDGYLPGSVTPDGKKLMLSGNGRTILYNLTDGTIKTFANREMRITNMIWLPDDKGFLYSDDEFADFWDSYESYPGLYYYSLKKKKAIRIRKRYDLSRRGGFVLPSSVKIKLPDTERNRQLSQPDYKDYNFIKICDW